MLKKFKEWSDLSKILHAMAILGFVLVIIMSILSCEDVRVGKSREEIASELYRTMFEVDSILMRIQYQLDTTTVDGVDYIIFERMNDGRN